MFPDELRAPDGRAVASIDRDRIGDVDAAMVRSLPSAEPAAVARAIVSRFADWQITVDRSDVAEALIDLGEVLVRHAFVMSADLTRWSVEAGGPSPAQLPIGPLRSDPDRYARLMTSAYPIGHVDHDPADSSPDGARLSVASYLSGAVVGPVRWDASFEAVIGDAVNGDTVDRDMVIGAIVVSTSPSGHVHPGGPWVTDIAVDPRWQGHGVGRALLTHAMHALVRAGDERLGLAVSHGNRARDLYERVGFVELLESWRLMITRS